METFSNEPIEVTATVEMYTEAFQKITNAFKELADAMIACVKKLVKTIEELLIPTLKIIHDWWESLPPEVREALCQEYEIQLCSEWHRLSTKGQFSILTVPRHRIG